MLFMQISIHGDNIYCLVDRGSSLNLTSFSLACNPRRCKPINVKGFTGSSTLDRMATLTFHIGGHLVYNLDVHVLDHRRHKVILGIPFLEKYEPTISFKRRTLMVGNTEVPFHATMPTETVDAWKDFPLIKVMEDDFFLDLNSQELAVKSTCYLTGFSYGSILFNGVHLKPSEYYYFVFYEHFKKRQ